MSIKLDKIRQRLAEYGQDKDEQDAPIDAILISSAENRRYMSGFTGSAGYLLISQDDATLVTDFRYVEQAGNQAPDYRIHRTMPKQTWFTDWTAAHGIKRIGFESDQMAFSTYQAFKKQADEAKGSNNPELVPTAGIVEKLRVYKDADELALLTKAIEIADSAIDEVSERICPGISEEAIAWELEKAMRERGAEMISFDTIVATGPNGALPHHRAGTSVVKPNDAIVIDMGAKYDGYCSDLTRTIYIGADGAATDMAATEDETFRKIYDIVLQAQLVAEEQVEAGMTGKQADAIARNIITDAGYGDKFGHSLGHGVGLAVHESPHVGPTAEDETLEDGMVFTIEPGIYIPGWGGVRIEDIVVLENGRARVISKARKL